MSQNLDLKKFIPKSLQNETLSSLVDNLFNRFVSQESSVHVAGTIGAPISGTQSITQPDLERQENALVPGLYYKAGTQDYLYTFKDLVDRLNALDADVPNMRTWAAEQTFNYSPPIDYDKFINYSYYYWVGAVLPNTPAPAWNPTNSPEYYVIAPPPSTSLAKMPVRLATTRNISRWVNDRVPEVLTLTFTSSSTFSIDSNLQPGGVYTTGSISPAQNSVNHIVVMAHDQNVLPGLGAPGLPDYQLCQFYIVNGTTPFSAGDKIQLTITYFTGEAFVSVSSPTLLGKGTINGVSTLSPFMYVDGVQVKIGDRILVKDQLDNTQNGIYVVNEGGQWVRSYDATYDSQFNVGLQIYVTSGSTQAGHTYELTFKGNLNLPGNGVLIDSRLTFSLFSTTAVSVINDWQLHNYWIHRDDLWQLAALGVTINNASQAQRPIIEYSSQLQLNEYVNSTTGVPCDYSGAGAVPLYQAKSRFNQIPQFDLYRYDGTHAGLTSGIWFYAESPEATVDSVLKRRALLSTSGDHMFSAGAADQEGRILFWKLSGDLNTIWSPGFSTPIPSVPVFTGTSLHQPGDIHFPTFSQTADVQDWTITLTSPTTATISGTRSGNLGAITVDVNAPLDDFTIRVASRGIPYVAGDTFTFHVWGPVSPRYVKELSDGSIVNYPGGYAGDQAASSQTGAWLTPLRMFQNLNRETQTTISFGDFTDHARSVIKNQLQFTGASFGDNNSRTIDFNYGVGGTIREFSSNFPLLASMLIEKDLSPLTIISFAEQQYNSALSSIDQFLINNLARWISAGNSIQTTTVNPAAADIQSLSAYFQQLRGTDTNLSLTFSDSIAKVTNWPATLPMLGLARPVVPTIAVDGELNSLVIIHHDGHVSPLAAPSTAFNLELAKTQVKRSDGTTTAGVIAETLPSNFAPYAQQLWLVPSTGQLFVFNVNYDAVTAPTAALPGQFWYNRSTQVLSTWDSHVKAWVSTSTPVSSRWIPFSPENIRNSLVLAIEQELYSSVHPAQQLNIDLINSPAVTSAEHGEVELASFAAKYGYDAYAPDYDPTNAFTWNYSRASISGVPGEPGIARWYDLYKSYFAAYGAPGLDRPDLYPWRLGTARFGATINKSAGWDAAYAGTTRPWSDQLWADIQSFHPGIKLCVNTTTDQLLPPYVSPTDPMAAKALTNVIPPGINLGYAYGQHGPVETVWMKSLEYLYGLARTYFRMFPLQFLDQSWGETYITSGSNLRLERNLQASLPASKFLLHGERLNVVNSWSPDETKARFYNLASGLTWSSTFSGTVSFTVTHCASSGQVGGLGPMGPSSTVFSAFVNGLLITHVFEGVPFSFSTGDVTLSSVTIDDLGIPYEVGDTLTISISPDTLTTSPNPTGADFTYGVLGCEGCVSPAAATTGSIISDVKNQPTFSFTPGQTKVFKGIGQWFTNLLRYSYIDTDYSTAAQAYRGWSVNLVHRLGALIRPDNLSITTTLGQVPTTGYNVMIKRSENTQSLWISALRVQVVQMGSKVLGANGLYVPQGDGSDWIFRIEVYNKSHPVAEYRVLDTSGPFTDFTALGGQNTQLSWLKFENFTGTTTSTMPLQVTGVQNVLNVLFGYSDFLQSQGFVARSSPPIDVSTGRTIDWQLEIERFINTVYGGVQAGQGIIINPFMDALYLQTPVGLMGRYNDGIFLDAYSAQAAYDVTGAAIPVKNLSVIRSDQQTVTYSNTPIFSAHVFIDEFEHALVFNNQFSSDPTSATIFNPFLGAYAQTAYLDFHRSAEVASKPTFDGFFLSGAGLTRNVSSSIDSLRDAYDSTLTFNEPEMSTHAMSLIGFQPKDYFSNLEISPAVQLDFWRALISAKGTNLSLSAFTNYKAFSESSVDEFWAYKVAEYGDSRERSFPEIKIEPSDCSRQFTSFQFYDNGDLSYSALPLFIQVEANDDSRWYSIDDLGTVLRFDSVAISEVVTAGSAGYVQLSNVYHNGDAFGPTITPSTGARVVNATTIYISTPGTYTVSGHAWNNQSQLSPVKLFDYSTSTLDKQVALWHPAANIHEYSGLELVNIQSPTDPAHYNYTTLVTDNPNYLELKPWGEQEVGRVWWDTSTLAYIPYFDSSIFPNREARNSRWGSLAEHASVDLYQWTESDYHPSEYNAQALLQEGDSTISSAVRLSGTVGFTNSYKSTRSVTIRPIAWSQTSTSNGNAHPAFGPASAVIMYNSNNQLIAGVGRLADINVISGYNFAAWDVINSAPIGEVSIGTNISYDIGSSVGPGTAIMSPVTVGSGTVNSLSMSAITNSSVFGTRIGQLTLSTHSNSAGASFLRLTDSSGFFQDVTLSDWSSTNLQTTGGDTLTLAFDQFGVQVSVTATSSVAITAADLGSAISNPNNDVFIREAVNYTPIIPLPDVVFSNESVFGISDGIDYGWKVWVVPTQAQLSADLPYPNNKWQPYLGTPTPVTMTADVVTAMQDSAASFNLVNGITVSRYTSTWAPWVQLKKTELRRISDGVTPASFTLPAEVSLDVNRLSVYNNGVQLAPAQLLISGNTVTSLNIAPEGTLVYLLYRPYQPTATDLAFNPTVSDNFQNQVWYKTDYQYTQFSKRDSSGNVASTKYYFWVTGKTVSPPSQSMSLAEAASSLQYGDSSYMIFSRLVADSASKSGAAFDSCAISGLGTTVTKSSSYKLRFLRDFTLREDPQQLKLKNTHAEWTLIRQHQTSKIPASLWLALTNAICGQDAIGNSLPAQTRVNYDAKHGTGTRYGFGAGQIFAESSLALSSLLNTVLNTSLTIDLGTTSIIDYITALGISANTTADSLRAQWFSDPITSRNTMNLIYKTSRASQVNEIFFSVLNDALANNYEFTDIFKTSMITVNSATNVAQQSDVELSSGLY